jgi:exocyst complex component 6
MIGKKFVNVPRTALTSNRMAQNATIEASSYMQELTQYLQNIMTTVLLGLPTEIKELIYFDALSHAATKILVGAINRIISTPS